MLKYMSGFGNEFATEALEGALPVGRNSPQKAPYGLYAEQISGTAFTAPRAENQSTWLYKRRPSAMHPPYRRIADGLLKQGLGLEQVAAVDADHQPVEVEGVQLLVLELRSDLERPVEVAHRIGVVRVLRQAGQHRGLGDRQ